MQHAPLAAYPPPPLTPATKPRRIAILGAGMAGLTAADLLVRAGHDVTVLEARERAGGRVHTLRAGFSDHLHAEAGAAFLPGFHALVCGYAAELGLQLRPIDPPAGIWTDYLRGTRVENALGPGAPWPVPLSDWERAHAPTEWLQRYLGSAPADVLATDPRAPGWPPASLAPYDDLSLEALLRSNGASDGAIAVIRLGYLDLWGEGIGEYSALLYLRDDALTHAPPPDPGGDHVRMIAHPASRLHRPGLHPSAGLPGVHPHIDPQRVYTLAEGNDRLPAALADRLRDVIRFRCPVRELHTAQHGVTVRFDCADGPRELVADRVLCTLPFGVLRDIPIDPPLPPDRARVIRDLPYTSVTRIFLEFRTRFWTDAGQVGSASTDLPEQPTGAPYHAGFWIEEPTLGQPGPAGILDCYMVGESARRLARLTEAGRAAVALDQLEKVWPGARAAYSGRSVSKSWDDDPWTRGDYCWFRPGQMRALLPHIAVPAGRIHFAGDHTSALPGWVQGAMESGVRAAHEVHAAD